MSIIKSTDETYKKILEDNKLVLLISGRRGAHLVLIISFFSEIYNEKC